MTLARYQDLALDAIETVLGRNKLPILVGGTPLYINAVVEGWRMPRVPSQSLASRRARGRGARERSGYPGGAATRSIPRRLSDAAATFVASFGRWRSTRRPASPCRPRRARARRHSTPSRSA